MVGEVFDGRDENIDGNSTFPAVTVMHVFLIQSRYLTWL